MRISSRFKIWFLDIILYKINNNVKASYTVRSICFVSVYSKRCRRAMRGRGYKYYSTDQCMVLLMFWKFTTVPSRVSDAYSNFF